jgi:BlaI family penicillinase repressor
MQPADKDIHISNAEWVIMKALWRKSPLALKEITREAQKNNDWTSNTIRTLLVRLIEKGAVTADRSSGNFKYSPVIEEKEQLKNEACAFVDKVFDGSVIAFIEALKTSGRITQQECEDIHNFLYNYKK